MLRPSLRETVRLAEEVSRADSTVTGGPWTDHDVFDLLARTELGRLAWDRLLTLGSKTASRRRAIAEEIKKLDEQDKDERLALVAEIRAAIPSALERHRQAP